jgi:hypothetical protein
MKLPILVLAFTGLMASAGVNAQDTWTPVTAKVRETYEVIDKTGRTISKEVKEGNFYRNSEGSTLEFWLTVDGDETRGGSGELSDNHKLIDYSLNMKTKIAIKMPAQEGEVPIKPDFLAGAKTSKLGQESIEGIVCHHTAVNLTNPQGRSQPIGSACQAADYGLTLKMDIRVVSPDGSTHHTLRELHEIRLGETPDAKLFQLSPEF